jgi:hypothetical protein
MSHESTVALREPHDVHRVGAITEREDRRGGRPGLATLEADALVDLVGDHPDAACPADVEQPPLIGDARDPAGRIGGRGEEQQARSRRGGGLERVEVEFVAPVTERERQLARDACESATIALRFGRAGERKMASPPGSMSERTARTPCGLRYWAAIARRSVGRPGR